MFQAGGTRRVLISGGCGFIGSHLLDRLLARNDVAQIVCVDSLWTGTLENISHIDDPRFLLHVGPIEEFRTEMRFDEAYHLASPASTNRRPDLTIARQLMPGWECKVPFEDGIRMTCDWFRTRLERGPVVTPRLGDPVPAA